MVTELKFWNPDLKISVLGFSGSRALGFGIYLKGHGDLVSTLIMEIGGVVIWLIGVVSLLLKSP